MKTIIKEVIEKSFKCICQNCKCVFLCDISELYQILRNRYRQISDRKKLTEFPKKDDFVYSKCPTENCGIDVQAIHCED